jgi:hypothetical protein
MNKLGIASAMALFLIGTANAQFRPGDPFASQVPTYAVEGIALGSRVKFDSSMSREYKCGPSEQFDGFTWCQKTQRGSARRGSFEATYSILHSKDGTVVYANRYQQPAFFDASETDLEIQGYSRKFGGAPRITRMPHRSRTSGAIMATWGNVELEPLDSDSVKLLGEGKSPKKGLLIDFLGNFARSAQEGLPIYRINGGAGFVRVGSFDQKGRGTVRVAVVDASTFQPDRRLVSAQPLTGPQNEDQRPSVNQGKLPAATKARNDAEAELAAAIQARRDAEATVERLQAELSTAINERTEADVARTKAEKVPQQARIDAEIARKEFVAVTEDANAAKEEIDKLMAGSGTSQSYVDVIVFIGICATAILLFVMWVLSRLLSTSPKHSVDAGRTDADLEVRYDDGALVPLSTASGSSAETEPSIDQGDLVKRGVVSAGVALPNHRLPQSSLLVMTVSQSEVPALGGSQHTDPAQSCVDEGETERARAGPPKFDGRALQLAIDPTTKEIVIRDLLRLGDADSRLVQELHNIYQQDLSAGRTPENHQYLTSHKLADSLKLDEPTVRQRVSRCRTTVHESYKQKFGQDPPKHLLIENKPRQGYRLNPHIQFVAIAELEQSASASHKPAPHVRGRRVIRTRARTPGVEE